MIAGILKKTELTEAQYRDIGKLSSTSFRTFLKSKKDFYDQYILGLPSKFKESSATLIGSMAHMKMLEEYLFDENYKLSNLSKPPGGMMYPFVNSLVENRLLYTNEEGELTVDFEEIVKTAYEASGYDIALDAVLNKFVKKDKNTGETPEDYFKEVLDAKFNGVTIVTVKDIAICDKVVEIAKNDEYLGYFFNEDGWSELKIEDWDLEGISVKMMIDRILPNHKDKILQPFDLKCLYDNQNFKRDYYLKQQGWIQAGIYTKGLATFVKEGGLGEKYVDYKVLPLAYVVCDTSCYWQPVRYNLSEEDIDKSFNGWEENGRVYRGITSIAQEIKFSQETGIWNRTQEDVVNKGERNL